VLVSELKEIKRRLAACGSLLLTGAFGLAIANREQRAARTGVSGFSRT
jgi:hypothetical protein